MTAVSSRNIQTQLHFFGNKTDNEMEAEREGEVLQESVVVYF